MSRPLGIVLVGLTGLIAAALLLPGASAAPPCPGGSVVGYFDYRDDVSNAATGAEEGNHDDYDLVEIQSCVDGDDIALGLKVQGKIDDKAVNGSYRFYLRGPGLLGDNIDFQDENATYVNDSLQTVVLNFSVTNDWLTIWIPKAFYGNVSEGWTLEASAGFSDDVLTISDMAELSTIDEFGDEEDLSLETSPFGSPTVTITSLNVTAEGSGYKLVATGTTTGGVDELRVTMGVNLTASGVGGILLWNGEYWLEQNLSEGDAKVELVQVGGSWASWRFTRNYTEAELKGAFGSLFTPGQATLEVRALTSQGNWGHASQDFQPMTTTTTPPPNGGGGGGGGSGAGSNSTMLIVLVAVVAAGAVAALFLMKKRKKAAPAPPQSEGPKE